MLSWSKVIAPICILLLAALFALTGCRESDSYSVLITNSLPAANTAQGVPDGSYKSQLLINEPTTEIPFPSKYYKKTIAEIGEIKSVSINYVPSTQKKNELKITEKAIRDVIAVARINRFSVSDGESIRWSRPLIVEYEDGRRILLGVADGTIDGSRGSYAVTNRNEVAFFKLEF